MTFFAITQQILDESFSSSNSTEIFMRPFCVQNFISIGLVFEELLCKRLDGRTDTLTDSIVYSRFFNTQIKVETSDLNPRVMCISKSKKQVTLVATTRLTLD